MPPRFLVILIVAFWLGITGWTVWRGVAPYLSSNEPPPFAIDVTDESTHSTVFWTIYQNNQEVGFAETEVREDQGGLFRLEARYKLKLLRGLASATVTNRYRVTPEGVLRGVLAEVELGPVTQPSAVKGVIEGPVANGIFQPKGEITFSDRVQSISFDPVPMTGQASILNPLHPVSRIKDLRPGRTWQVPLFNPVSLVLTAKPEGKGDPLIQFALDLARSQGDAKQITLFAQVEPDPQQLVWDREPQECLVVNYHADEHSARTWVRARDGLVLRQDAKYRDDTIVLIRRGDKDGTRIPAPGTGMDIRLMPGTLPLGGIPVMPPDSAPVARPVKPREPSPPPP